MTVTVHSKVGASVAERFFNCPGSVRLCATVPNPPTVYAAEGTVAHDVGSGVLLSKSVPVIGMEVRQDGFRIKVTDEMMDAVDVYVNHVRALCDSDEFITMLVEHEFHLAHIHPDLYGTADCVIWKPKSRVLHVIDYKHGAGKPVSVKGNKQLRYYALGALLSLGFNAHEVTARIVQPRCEYEGGAIRSETFAAFDLIEWAADLLAAVKATEDPKAPLVPGDHCRGTFCPAAAICPALAERALAVARTEFSPVVPYDPQKLKFALDSRDALKAFIKALDEFAYAEAMAGRLPAEVGYKLVEKRAIRQWKDPSAVATHIDIALNGAKLRGCYTEPELKSPAQVEKIVGKKTFTAIEKDHVIKVSSGMTLAPVDDPRPAVRILDAAAEFASVPVVTEVTE